MSIIGGILAAIGCIIALIYGIILLIKAFKESVWWGLGSLFVPFVGLIFVFMHWNICKKPFLMALLGTVIYAVGFALMMPALAE